MDAIIAVAFRGKNLIFIVVLCRTHRFIHIYGIKIIDDIYEN